MTTGTIYVNFSGNGAPELVRSGENRADGASVWASAERDREWQAEQSEFLQVTASADAEALFSDE